MIVGIALAVAIVLVMVLYRRGATRAELRALGERLYHEQSCVVCHGQQGHGDGERSRALDPPPRDFRVPDAYVQGTTARDIAQTLNTGVRVHPSQMPSFSHLSERERLALGEFIVSLQRQDGSRVVR